MPLPFWDDFSFVGKAGDTLWASKESVRMADGFAINPPSIGVAVFDALNAEGLPYSTDLITAGFSDSLLSRKIKMADVVPAQRDSVFLSFQYQWKGNGEAPDASDYLQVNFLNSAGKWVVMDVIQKPVDADETKFYNFIVQVKDAEFFHNEFQFLIIRYGRLSGAFDTWMVDYVYLGTNRSISSFSFPDRALSSNLTSLFGEYFSAPKDHFEVNPVTVAPTFLAATQFESGDPVAYSTYLTVNSYSQGSNNSSNSLLDGSGSFFIPVGEIKKDTLGNLPQPSFIDFTSDSTSLSIQIILESGDISQYVPGDPNYDASPEARIFKPINFRNNDTTRTNYWLSNYYAYDDGVAEYSVVLAQAGKAAFKFTQLSNTTDTLTGAYIYFPTLTGKLSNIVTLQVYDEVDNKPGNLLAEEVVSVKRIGTDVFAKIEFKKGVLVNQNFYIGWEQPNNGRLAIGLDRSADRASQLFGNNTGVWNNPSNVRGTLMIRPIFGDGDITTSVESSVANVTIYPNPVSNSFTISTNAEVIGIYTSAGSPVSFSSTHKEGSTRVTLHQTPAGLAIIQFRVGTIAITRKILIQQ